MAGVEVQCSSLRDYLRRRIEQLEQELSLLRALYSLVESACGRREQGYGVVKARNSIRLVLPSPVPKSNPYIRYLLRVLGQLQREYGDKLEYTVEESEGKVKSIVVVGLDRDTYDEVEAAMEYVASKLGIRVEGGEGED